MKKLIKSSVISLAFVIVAGCATQSAPIPPFLAPTFAQMKMTRVASISYVDEEGQPISEEKFAAQFKNGQRFVAMHEVKDGLPDVTLHLRYGNADDDRRR